MHFNKGSVLMSFTISPDEVKISRSKLDFEPSEISYYSTDSNLKDHYEDVQSLRYYDPKHKKSRLYNLANGYKNFKPFIYDRNVPRHASILNAVKFIECKNHEKIDVDIITNRGILLDMLFLINRDCAKNFDFNLIKFDDQLFIADTDYRDEERLMNEDYLKAVYAGYKFETIITTSEYNKRSPEEPLTNNNANFKSVIKVGLDHHKILIRSEIDGAMEPKDVNNKLSNYVEFKTHARHAKKSRYFDAKLFKTYYQCKISGMDNFWIGFRNRSFQLIYTTRYKLNEIAVDNFKRGEDWLKYVLDWVKSVIEEEGGDYWKMSYDTQSRQLKLTKIEDKLDIADMFKSGIGEDFQKHRLDKAYLS